MMSFDTNVGLCECRFFSLSVNQPPTSPHRQPLPTPQLPPLRLSSAQHAILHSPNLSDRKSSSARVLSRSHPPSPSRTAPSIHLNWGSGKTLPTPPAFGRRTWMLQPLQKQFSAFWRRFVRAPEISRFVRAIRSSSTAAWKLLSSSSSSNSAVPLSNRSSRASLFKKGSLRPRRTYSCFGP
jgi:hypothetical protein